MFIPVEFLIVLLAVPSFFFAFLGYKAGKGSAYSQMLAKAKLAQSEQLEAIKNDILQRLMEKGLNTTTIKAQEIFNKGQETIDAFESVNRCHKFVE